MERSSSCDIKRYRKHSRPSKRFPSNPAPRVRCVSVFPVLRVCRIRVFQNAGSSRLRRPKLAKYLSTSSLDTSANEEGFHLGALSRSTNRARTPSKKSLFAEFYETAREQQQEGRSERNIQRLQTHTQAYVQKDAHTSILCMHIQTHTYTKT
jgi:hypothetical protein